MDKFTREARLEELRLKQEKAHMIENLPHLYGLKHYDWSRKFFDSIDKYLFLTAANQIGKSSTNIRTIIDWCTNPLKWKMWRTKPVMLWYLYPTKEIATLEFKMKWINEFLPRGKFEDHKIFGWRAEWRQGNIQAIHFKSGVSIVFKSYMTQQEALQSGTCHAIFFDEEMPADLWPELVMRTSATDGFIRGVFTATQGQNFWFDVMEVRGKNEKLPFATKMQISLYDCQFYEDGTASHWSLEKIKEREMACGTEAQRIVRIMGRFAKEEGLKYGAFDRKLNVKPPMAIPHDWHWYCGVDPGGGGDGHKSSICLVAVRPDYQYGRVVRSWKGNEFEITTAGDVYLKFQEMRGSRQLMGQYYDWASKDFNTIATRNGEPFEKADKSHITGESIINTLFKNQALDIDDTEENQDLIDELLTLRKDTPKKYANDDAIDGLRYAITRVNWSMEGLVVKSALLPRKQPTVDDERRRTARAGYQEQLEQDIKREIQEWNEIYEQY